MNIGLIEVAAIVGVVVVPIIVVTAIVWAIVTVTRRR